MNRVAQLLLSTVLCVALAGCSATPPRRYEDVKNEALAALQTVADLIPEPKTVRPRPEQEPYGCNDPLLGMNKDGAFFTGYWEVDVSEQVDIRHFIAGVRDSLGDGWRTEPQLIEVSFPQANLIQEATGVSVTIEESDRDGRKGIDLLAISRCGIEEQPTP